MNTYIEQNKAIADTMLQLRRFRLFKFWYDRTFYIVDGVTDRPIIVILRRKGIGGAIDYEILKPAEVKKESEISLIQTPVFRFINSKEVRK